MSYESMSGLGQSYNIYQGAAGLGALGAPSDCGPAGNLGPAGGKNTGTPYKLCGTVGSTNFDSDPVAQLCNKTYDPYQCYSIRTSGRAFLGRPPGVNWGSDPSTWVPLGTPAASASGGGSGSSASGDDNTMLYVGLVFAGLVVIGGVVYWKKRKAG